LSPNVFPLVWEHETAISEKWKIRIAQRHSDDAKKLSFRNGISVYRVDRIERIKA